MGLTIHYSIKSKTTTSNLIKKLEAVRQKCLDLPFKEVGEIEHTIYTPDDFRFFNYLQHKYNYPNNSFENLEKRDKALKDRGLDIWVLIRLCSDKQARRAFAENINIEVIKWDLWAGNGCEDTQISFTRQENSNKIFMCRGFTKTQYAEQFVKCHLLVVKLFDIFKENSFQVKINDEGHYWETRDLTVLAQNINDYTNLIKDMFGTLSKQVEKSGLTIEAPITECENYMKIKDTK